MIITIVLIIISTTVSISGIVYGFIHHEKYGSKLNLILNDLLFLFLGIFFFTFLNLSTNTYFNTDIALIFWKLSLVFWLISVACLSTIHIYVIEHKKIINPSIFLYSFLAGITISLLFFPDSIKIIQEGENYIFIFQNFHILIFILIYNAIAVILMAYRHIRNISSFRDTKSNIILAFLGFQFSLLIILFSNYLLTQNILIKNIYLFLYLIGAIMALFTIVKNPFLFYELTNKIYDFIVFHRSGLLLYSYNFETGKESDTSFLKGPILIGISHILSNFAGKKDQLNLLKMEEMDIIFEYDNDFGYAVLLITTNRNSIINKGVQQFMVKFSDINKNNLLEISNSRTLIDISIFKNAKEIIVENFKPYIIR